MMRQLTLASVLALAGCGSFPAQAEQPDLTADIKRLEEEQRRTGERVSDIRTLIESDQLEGIYTLLGKILDNQRIQGDSIVAIQRVQGEFKVTLASSEDRMIATIAQSSSWNNTQTIGVAGSGIGISAIAGGALLYARRRQSALPALPAAIEGS